MLALLRSQQNPRLPGPLDLLPSPVKAGLGVVAPIAGPLGTLASPGGQLGQALVGAVGHYGERAGQGIGGELALLAALAQAKGADAGVPGFDPNSTATQASRAALAQGFAHPGRAMETIRTGPDPGMAWLAGALEMFSNPTNLIPVPGHGAAKAAEGAIPTAAPAVDRLVAGLADRAAAREALAKVLGNVPEGELPKVGGKKQLGPIMPPEQFGYARGNVPLRALPKVGGRAQLGPVPPPSAIPVQPVEDLLGAARTTARPNPLEQLLGAGQNTAAREVTPIQSRRTIAQIEAAFPKVVEARPGQVGLPQESGTIPGERLRLGLYPDQADFLDEIRATVGRGDQKEIGAVRDFATTRMQIPADRVNRTIEEAYQALGAEDRAARLQAIEGSPYFDAFQYFKKDGTIRPVNPTNGKRIPGAAQTRDQVWNLPGSGYDEVADGILARFQAEGHNQNYGQGTDDFWRGAQDAFKEYQALKKPGAVAALPEVVSGSIPASTPLLADMVTPAQEAAAKLASYGPLDHPVGLSQTAAPDLPGYAGQTRQQALGALTSDEIDKLVNIAYPVEKAQANAILAHPDPTDLADAAINRITASDVSGRPLAARLQQLHPDLAEKLAFLPDPEAAVSAIAEPAALSNVDIPASITDPTERAAWQAKYVGQSQAGTDILASADKVGGSDLTQAGMNALSPQERMAALRKLAGGGDIAAGGGGMGLVVPRLGSTLVGAGTGAAIGGVAGATQGTTTQDRLENAALGAGTGAVIGGNLSAAAPEIAQAARHLAPDLGDTALDPGLWADAARVGWRNFQDVRATAGVHAPKEAFDAFWAQWRSQVVNTLKQVPQDAATRKFVQEGIARREFGVTDGDIRAFQGVLRRERADGTGSLANPLTARLRALGATGVLGDMQGVYGVDFGTELGQEAGKQAGGLGRTINGALIGLGSGVKTVNPIAPIYGAARGYAAPFVDGMIRYVNGIQHDAFRYALATKALDRDVPRLADGFLQDLAQRGVDTAQLAAKGGYFAPDEVAAVAGQQAGQDWAALLAATIKGQGDRIAFLAGDFRKASETGAERAVSKVVPFARWGIRYAPVLAEIAARHPVATMYVLREMEREKDAAAAQGKQAYQSGVTIDDTTPLVGLAARVRNGGSAGTLTVDPLGMLVPFGNAGGGADLPDDATGYQRLADLGGRVGFQGNPAVQAAMYVTGQGRAPSSLSRTAGLEGLADTAPVLIRAGLRATGHQDAADRVPDVGLPSGRTLLDAARNVVAPAVEKAGLPTTGGGPSDPAERRYAELVLAQTQKPLSDPANRRYLETMGATDNPLWQLAILQSRAAGAVGNVASMTSPAQTTAQTTQAAAAQAAPKLPYTSYQIGQAPAAQRPAMLAANDQATRANPASATYTNISGKSRTDQLIGQWELEHIALKRVNPTYYAQALKNYKAGLK